MIRQSNETTSGSPGRRWGAAAIMRWMLLGTLLIPLSARATSIFDDDFPAAKPAAPAVDVPAPKPPTEPGKPIKPEPAEPTTPPVDSTGPKATTEPAKPELPQTRPSEGSLPLATDAPARRPIPTTDERTKSRTLFEELYVKELTDHAPASRRALAEKLLTQAPTVNDVPSDEYILLVGATHAAAEGYDLTLSCRAADMLADMYAVDALPYKRDAAVTTKLRAATPAATADNCQIALKVADQLLAADAANGPGLISG
jgi:hypothetical protein